MQNMTGGTLSLTLPTQTNMEEGLVSPHWLRASLLVFHLAKLIKQTTILILTQNTNAYQIDKGKWLLPI